MPLVLAGSSSFTHTPVLIYPLSLRLYQKPECIYYKKELSSVLANEDISKLNQQSSMKRKTFYE
ncbi:hypothetical protein KTT_35020 [Tengunoibacter tsumagoiensis]|uniref:Uncharacterized protein n=1 Tax=Tengunoibacter tsumagoiensis TaxID=2014871 RepID=A0A402A3B8_9CHLR|nr:hypothetical protein KTT_35020 [Tengunoibacter tsumagoiensis]